MSANESRHRRRNPPSATVPCRIPVRCQPSDLFPVVAEGRSQPSANFVFSLLPPRSWDFHVRHFPFGLCRHYMSQPKSGLHSSDRRDQFAAICGRQRIRQRQLTATHDEWRQTKNCDSQLNVASRNCHSVSKPQQRSKNKNNLRLSLGSTLTLLSQSTVFSYSFVVNICDLLAKQVNREQY